LNGPSPVQTPKTESSKTDIGSSSKTDIGAKERIIPIRLESGEEIMPIFTKLEEPEPPKWY
jgi:hypothetical protein